MSGEFDSIAEEGTAPASEPDDPLELFGAWMADAEASEPEDPNAVALATVDADGLPNVRMVLLKGFDARGFTFFTNFESAKGREILESRKAALCFHWKSLQRQVRLRGPVGEVEPKEADDYFATRARTSRIGAWASRQSRPLAGRFVLDKAVAKFTAKFATGDIPRPPHWSGFRISPVEIEFWRQGDFRLHHRLVFRRVGEQAPWSSLRLFP